MYSSGSMPMGSGYMGPPMGSAQMLPSAAQLGRGNPMPTMPFPGSMSMGVPGPPMSSGMYSQPMASGMLSRGTIPGPPPTMPEQPAWVPAESGVWQPRVTYRVRESGEEEAKEEPIPTDKAELIRYLQNQDDKVIELKNKCKELREHHHGNHDEWQRRVEELEAHVLSAKLKPVADGDAAVPRAPHIPLGMTPNGLLQEFRMRTTAEDVADKMTIQEQREEEEQRELAIQSQMLGLPSIQQLALPHGSKIIDIRLVDGVMSRRYMKEQIERDEFTTGYGATTSHSAHQAGKPRAMPPPTLKGRIYDSNMALTPSQYHPVGPVSQMGLLQNLYPIDRAPMNYESVFESAWPGAEEQWYTAYGDFQQARDAPKMKPEVTWERDVDRGDLVRNVRYVQG